LIEYLASFAEEFLSHAQVIYRVEFPKDYTDRTIAAEIRHDVMLAVKEALNNAVRHGHSDEVLLRFLVLGDSLEILVQDEGCGFDPDQVNGNGLANLEQRMAKLNGSCHIKSARGAGTSVTLKLTLPK
jgi:signal transduction histidine kinase